MAQAKKQPTKKSTRKRKSAKKAKVLRLVDFMPEDERLAALKRAAERLDEVEQTQELLKAVQKLADSYRDIGKQRNERVGGIEESAQERIDELRERVAELAAVQSAIELSERVGGRATEELDEMLDRMGLMRKAVHEEEVALLKKRHKSARKAAETKARKAAERELKKQLRAAS